MASAAIEVLDAATKSMESATQPEPLASLLLILARRQFQLGDSAGGRKRLDAYLEAMEKNTIRYGGDYPLYRPQAATRARGRRTRPRGALGRWIAGAGPVRRRAGLLGRRSPDRRRPGPVVAATRHSSAKERYETLRAWTMPAKDRRVVRILTSLAADNRHPRCSCGPLPTRNPGRASPGRR